MTDTMMGGGGGGVGIRLFTTGGEVVKRTFEGIKDSGKKMWAQIALGERSANPALRAMSSLSGDVQRSMTDLASRSGAAGSALSAFGAAGLVAAAALGGLLVAAAAAARGMNDAMVAAAALTDAAGRIGVGVEGLQKWRYVADEADVSVGSLEANLEKLNGTLGAFKLGIGDGKIKPIFEELGISKASLDEVDSANELMLLLADTLGQVKDRAAQVRLARGLGVEESLPILRLGSERIRELSGEAEHLGFVVDAEVVASLDRSERAMERAGQQMKVLRDTAVAPLAESMADAATYVAGLAAEFSNIESHAPKWIQILMAIGRVLPGSGAMQRITEGVMARALPDVAPAGGGSTDEDDPALLRQRMAVQDFNRRAGGGFELQGHSSGGVGGGKSEAEREAERLAREQDRALDQLEQEGNLAERRLAQERFAGGTAEDRAQLALSLLALEREQRDEKRAALKIELERTGGLSEAVAAQLDQLVAMDRESDVLAERQILEEKRRDLAAAALRVDQAREKDALDLLDIEAQLAGTYRERLEVERRILVLQQASERRALEAAIDEDGQRTPEEVVQLQRQRWIHEGRLEIFDHNAREEMREQFKSYGHEVVDAIESGRIGEHIADELKSRLIDMALNGLFDFLNPQGGSSQGVGGNLLSATANFVGSILGFGGGAPGPGRAGGGDLWRGYRHPVAETGRPELMLIGGKGQVTGAAETVRLLRDALDGAGGANGGRTVVHQHHHHNDFRGAVMTEQLVAELNAQVRASEDRAVRRAGDQSRRNLAGMSDRLADLGTV